METRYGIDDALKMVLLPDGNISDFDDDDSDDESLPSDPEEYIDNCDKGRNICGLEA